jgi:hypothetical protein
MSIGSKEFFCFMAVEIHVLRTDNGANMTCSKWSKSGIYQRPNPFITKYAKEMSIIANNFFFCVLEVEINDFRKEYCAKHYLHQMK